MTLTTNFDPISQTKKKKKISGKIISSGGSYVILNLSAKTHRFVRIQMKQKKIHSGKIFF